MTYVLVAMQNRAVIDNIVLWIVIVQNTNFGTLKNLNILKLKESFLVKVRNLSHIFYET